MIAPMRVRAACFWLASMAGLLRGQSRPAPTAEELAASLDDPVVAQVDSTAYFRMESHDAPAADVEVARGLLWSILVRLRAGTPA